MTDETASAGDGRTLGTCPTCEMALPDTSLLIEYNAEDGNSRMYADCPHCETPVHPE